MARQILMIVHAASGVLGIVIGLWAFAPPRNEDHRTRMRAIYSLSLVVLVVTLVPLLAVDWTGLDVATRVAFSALTLLGVAMLARVFLARRDAHGQAPGWENRYIDHIYFTYVALWMGLLILPALNLPLPAVSIPLLVIGVLATGHMLLGRLKRAYGVASDDQKAIRA